MIAQDLRARLLLAAARAYVAANALPADADPEKYAEHLARTWATDPEAVPPGVVVPVDLRDLLEAAEAVKREAAARGMADTLRGEISAWLAGWGDARAALRSTGPRAWKSRAMDALRVMGLTGGAPLERTNRARDLRQRWEELTQGLFDSSLNMQHPKLNKRAALERVGQEFFPKSIDPSAAARQALHRAGVRGLPRM